ncbi:MAG TPA: squalene/phytoene synthase family protein [Gaiellaceae bacterium]|nr:squalene/phytoene synthase family protein [Gaiellaceae bacterium]
MTVARAVEQPSTSAILAKAQHENFPVALRILPRTLRERLETIYGFARLVDDLGDEYEGDRNAALDWLEQDLARAFDGRAEHPLLQRVTVFVHETGVARDPFRRLIEANRQDQIVSHYATWDELAHYCTLSANPVGELVLASIGAATPERIRWSDDVCTALQVLEHLQDVDEDAARGRVYIPAHDRTRALERARSLLASGIPLVDSLHGAGKLAVAAYVGGGRAAANALERGSRFAGKRERVAETWRVLRAGR